MYLWVCNVRMMYDWLTMNEEWAGNLRRWSLDPPASGEWKGGCTVVRENHRRCATLREDPRENARDILPLDNAILMSVLFLWWHDSMRSQLVGHSELVEFTPDTQLEKLEYLVEAAGEASSPSLLITAQTQREASLSVASSPALSSPPLSTSTSTCAAVRWGTGSPSTSTIWTCSFEPHASRDQLLCPIFLVGLPALHPPRGAPPQLCPHHVRCVPWHGLLVLACSPRECALCRFVPLTFSFAHKMDGYLQIDLNQPHGWF